MFHRKCSWILFVILAFFMFTVAAGAASAPEVTLASVGWTGVTIKTELAVDILESLGYKAKNITMSVPIVYMALSKGDADAFLGNWMPSMANIAEKYFKDGSVIQYTANMPGAKYTLAVPTYCYEAGLKNFSDIVKFGDKLDWKIYGIEAGNDGNLIIQDMIDKNMFGLGKFKLVSSSEVAMLAEVKSRTLRKAWIVFLGWAPHSMNERIDMTYLDGSTADTFGADNGTATVWTNIRKGLDKDMPNVALFLKNLKFPVSMMNQIMTTIHQTDDISPLEAGLQWIANNPESYKGWLDGVKTADGKPALPVFEAHLKEKMADN